MSDPLESYRDDAGRVRVHRHWVYVQGPTVDGEFFPVCAAGCGMLTRENFISREAAQVVADEHARNSGTVIVM